MCTDMVVCHLQFALSSLPWQAFSVFGEFLWLEKCLIGPNPQNDRLKIEVIAWS